MGSWFISSDSSNKGPFELDDEEDDDDTSSANSDDENEDTEFSESSEIDPMDVESLVSSFTSSLTIQLVFPWPRLFPSMIPLTFISAKICSADEEIIDLCMVYEVE